MFYWDSQCWPSTENNFWFNSCGLKMPWESSIYNSYYQCIRPVLPASPDQQDSYKTGHKFVIEIRNLDFFNHQTLIIKMIKVGCGQDHSRKTLTKLTKIVFVLRRLWKFIKKQILYNFFVIAFLGTYFYQPDSQRKRFIKLTSGQWPLVSSAKKAFQEVLT